MNKGLMALLVLGIAVAGYAAWYLASPLFIDLVVNETLPVVETNSTKEGYENVPPQFEVQILREGMFIDADDFHKTSGTANIVLIEDKTYLRLENFKTTNGPDLKVYLSNDLGAESYVSLGDLKGNVGDQNYEISQEIDISQYKYVLIWCEAFGVLFGSAELK